MVMPHLILVRTTTEDDAAKKKGIAWFLDKLTKMEENSLILDAKAGQERMSRTKAN